MNAIEIAKKLTARTAEMKDWRIRNKYNRKMRQIARDLVELNGGYIIATPAELQAIYDVQVGKGDERFVWGIDMNSVWKKLQFSPIDTIE